MLLLSFLSFDLQGHRGCRGLRPENTLSGFQHALDLGVDTLELDLGLTADGVLVVAHDPHLTGALAQKDGTWITEPVAIHDLTLEELRTYQVGELNPDSDYARKWPEQIPVMGARVPTLDEVLAMSDTVRFNIETKIDPTEPGHTASPEEFAAAIRATVPPEMRDRVTVQSFDWRTLRLLQDEFSTACLTKPGMTGRFSSWTAEFEPGDYRGVVPLVAAAGCDIWSPYHKQVNRSRVEEAHRLGLAVVPWTVNDPERGEKLIAMGVDGLITDYPDRVRGP